MRGAYLECQSGIAGDMCVGALLDVGLDFYVLREALARLPLSGYSIGYTKVKRSSIKASQFKVDVHEKQPARYYDAIKKMVTEWEAPPPVRDRALAIFEALAEAEAKVHNVDLKDVHFHEVGAVDSIIDVCAAAWGFHHLELERVVCSPVNVGSGTVKTDHGVLPVPAPATLELLRDAPIYSEGPEVELTTPTGAAIVRTQTSGFGTFPSMIPRVTGVGAGTRELDRPNVVRITVGKFVEETPSTPAAETSAGGPWERDEIDVLETHIDDAPPEILGFLVDELLTMGALDVAQTPVSMKKTRPGVGLTVLAPAGEGERFAERVARETGTLGLRLRRESRLKVPRKVVSVKTRFGDVRLKLARLGEEEIDASPEFDDCAAAARAHGVPIRMVYAATLEAHTKTQKDK
ncbi:MAG: nickel pincer cofactor biosynthesis protein LarC [Myxococcota bacterium]